MRLHSTITLIVLAALMLMPTPSDAAGINATQKREIGEMLTRIVAREVSGGSVRVDRTRITNERIEIYASIGLSYYPFREENVAAIYDSVRTVLPAEYADSKLSTITVSRSSSHTITAHRIFRARVSPTARNGHSCGRSRRRMPPPKALPGGI